MLARKNTKSQIWRRSMLQSNIFLAAKNCTLKLLIQEKTKSIRLCIWNDSCGKMLESSNMFIQELHWNLIINNVLIHLEIFCEYISASLMDMSTWTNCLLRSEADQQQHVFDTKIFFAPLYCNRSISLAPSNHCLRVCPRLKLSISAEICSNSMKMRRIRTIS